MSEHKLTAMELDLCNKFREDIYGLMTRSFDLAMIGGVGKEAHFVGMMTQLLVIAAELKEGTHTPQKSWKVLIDSCEKAAIRKFAKKEHQ